MSNLTLRGNPAGTGTFIVESPNSNSNRTLTLPDATTTLVGTDAAQTLTNKTINGGALTLMTAQASTSGTAIDFTGIPSWAKRVTVILSGVSLSGTSNVLIQIGDAGGVEASGYTVYAVVNTGAGGSQQAAFTSGFPVYDNGRTSTSAAHGTLVLTNLSGNTWVGSGTFGDQENTASIATACGTKTLSDVLTQIRITTVNGTDTFDAGTVNIMYEG